MTTIFFVITAAFSLVFAASNMSIVATHTTSSGSGNLHQSNADPISTPQSHKPCPNGSAPDVDGKCQTTVCPNGSAPDVDGKCQTTVCPNGSAPDVDGKCQTTVCPNGSAPDVDGNCTRTPSTPQQPPSSLENNSNILRLSTSTNHSL